MTAAAKAVRRRPVNLAIREDPAEAARALGVNTPLAAAGLHLGPVGACIVGEVIIGLVQLNRRSSLASPSWRPTLPARSGRVSGEFRMIDFLTFAGVDPRSRGQ